LIDHVTLKGSCLDVHLAEASLKATKSFTHGGVVFDITAGTVTFGSLPPVGIPVGFSPVDGASLNFRLIGPDGEPRKQTRSGMLRSNEKFPGVFRISGKSKTESKFSAEDGWGMAVYKYRAYFTHTGMDLDGIIPEWLKGSIDRQKGLWNRLAWLCRDARRKCSPVPTEEIAAFVQSAILPTIDAFNNSLGISKRKIKHPKKLKTDSPGVDGLWSFVGLLRGLMEKGRPVPDGLLDQVVAFAEQFKADYTPLNEFLNDLNKIAERESKALPMPIEGVPFEVDHAVVKLRPYEVRPVINAFKSVIKRRKSVSASWSDGWPLLKYPDSPKADDWGLHYYFNKAGVATELLESPKGVPGLTFGQPLRPSSTGHTALHGLAAKRKMRQATISIPGYNNEAWELRFAVLQHRDLPLHSHVKEWKLIYNEGKLWLCLTVEMQTPKSLPGEVAAGLDIGWRRTESGIRFGTLYEPESKTIRELTIDLQKSPVDPKDRTAFRIDMGPTHKEKRHIAKLLPTWKPGDAIPNAMELRKSRGILRSSYKDTAKALLKTHLGEKLPGWFDKAGVTGLLRLGEEFKDDALVQSILADMKQKNEQLERPDPKFSARTTQRLTNGATGRLEYGQLQVAHDVCRYLRQKGINRLITESTFLAKIAQEQDNEDPDSLKNSQKYRQFAAVGRFVEVLKRTAAKYGVTVDDMEAINTTRICSSCNALNPGTANELFVCLKCAAVHKQDDNAAINLSRFGTDPDLAEMALHAGQTA